ncbi:MAG: dihydroorotase [Bacteroidia bacterium]|nr:dihydroorotase [Bacteroidia bacterium]MBT8275061.1 dihydroorotase [Bacteroidia bacterium]NNF32387.1 dihydroorotase [Flavobacteriaceae bacterium]NNK55412.1 dihydroorotase [Flavobacteriaceae bacterium]NNM09069.1 dihydroorotase [Flavobacteriaceae bacterium]
MSQLLLKSATIVDTGSKHHLKKRDVLIENGIIRKIAASIKNDTAKVVSLKNLHISKGWFDSSVSFGEPGYEERETVSNGLRTAAFSGFCHVAVNPNTNPVTDTKAGVQFLKAKAEGSPVNLYPVGSLTVKSGGKDLAELYDMHNEGAVAFGDYKQPVKNANLLKIALQYCQNFNGLVQSMPLDQSVARNGVMNEEVNSTRLGLKGIPALAEELQITRDLYLLQYTGGKLHIPTISTKEAVSLIRDAKKKGLDVSCSVAVSNLVLTDDALEGFDTSYKLLPPLRNEIDRKALIKGLKDGTIDGVTSDHDPIDIEHKKTEFDHAMFGSIGLESCFGALNAQIGMEASINALVSLTGRFGIETAAIEENALASLTLFDSDTVYEFSKENILSTSHNAAFLGSELKGKAYGIYSNKKLVLNK